MRKSLLVPMAIGCFALLFGCKLETNLDNDPMFKPMIGRVLRTKKDLVVMTYPGGKKTLALDKPGTSGVPELKDIPKQLPSEYYGRIIHGMLPAGSTFQITHIEKVVKFEFSFIDYYGVVTSPGDFKGKIVDVGILTNQSTAIPTFIPEYVEEISSLK